MATGAHCRRLILAETSPGHRAAVAGARGEDLGWKRPAHHIFAPSRVM
ncbi:MAG: hypothetical protein M3008_04390 [Chloroflexota bacterium]|nr:hypothetical protein [Chloroflexota bacterium]